MFKFGLNPVLSLREKVEEQKKRELGAATSQKEVIVQKQVTLINEKNSFLHTETTNKAIDITRLKASNRYKEYLSEQIALLDEEIEVAESKIEVKRAELLEAVKGRKILSNLKDRKQEEHRVETLKEEQNILDEIASFKYFSSTKEVI